MPRRYRSPIALILTVTLAAPSGFAAPKPPKPKTVREELPDAARKDWDAARDLLDTSDFAGALVEYKRAYDESKNPRVLYNVAVCLKNLRHYARAEVTFKQELTDGAGKISAAEEADVKSAIQALDPFVSTLEVTANETGATLLIDGEAVGQTPFDKPVPIDVGPHEVRLHKDGFVDAVQTTTIRGRDAGEGGLEHRSRREEGDGQHRGDGGAGGECRDRRDRHGAGPVQGGGGRRASHVRGARPGLRHCEASDRRRIQDAAEPLARISPSSGTRGSCVSRRRRLKRRSRLTGRSSGPERGKGGSRRGGTR